MWFYPLNFQNSSNASNDLNPQGPGYQSEPAIQDGHVTQEPSIQSMDADNTPIYADAIIDIDPPCT